MALWMCAPRHAWSQTKRCQLVAACPDASTLSTEKYSTTGKQYARAKNAGAHAPGDFAVSGLVGDCLATFPPKGGSQEAPFVGRGQGKCTFIVSYHYGSKARDTND